VAVRGAAPGTGGGAGRGAGGAGRGAGGAGAGGGRANWAARFSARHFSYAADPKSRSFLYARGAAQTRHRAASSPFPRAQTRQVQASVDGGGGGAAALRAAAAARAAAARRAAADGFVGGAAIVAAAQLHENVDAGWPTLSTARTRAS